MSWYYGGIYINNGADGTYTGQDQEYLGSFDVYVSGECIGTIWVYKECDTLEDTIYTQAVSVDTSTATLSDIWLTNGNINNQKRVSADLYADVSYRQY